MVEVFTPTRRASSACVRPAKCRKSRKPWMRMSGGANVSVATADRNRQVYASRMACVNDILTKCVNVLAYLGLTR